MELYKEMSESVVNLDEERAIELVHKALSESFNLHEVIEQGYAHGIRRVGELWEEGVLFLPELMRSAIIMQNCLDLIIPHLQNESESVSLGTVVIATIEGDIHSIGKTIVATMLRAYGFKVFDLGADVPVDTIINEAIEKNADIIGVSALLTTTMIGQKKLIQKLSDRGIESKFKVILGGAPVTKSWVEECRAAGFAENAVKAVKLVESLLDI
ncbi:hypothetical protein LCGC14_0765410 [marine sediment metagenome]|uniref:B12-binding domain-containing protein n=1 Tax=marine sediment metagenome TaxID=412755 RepID=A0A0F9Q003_9ZZZZ